MQSGSNVVLENCYCQPSLREDLLLPTISPRRTATAIAAKTALHWDSGSACISVGESRAAYFIYALRCRRSLGRSGGQLIGVKRVETLVDDISSLGDRLFSTAVDSFFY